MKDVKKLFTTFLFQQQPIHHAITHITLLCARIYAGYTIMGAGLDKLPLKDWLVDQVTTIGFPFPTFFAWLATFSEFAFGFLLIIGLLTRLSGLVLAFTIGVAAFGFHQVLPLTGMHITQHYLWLFMLLAVIGPGKFSLDFLIRKPGEMTNTRWVYIAAPSLIILLSIGLFIEFGSTEPAPVATELAISSINIPGSFNNWDPGANAMIETGADEYELDIEFNNPGLIEFKFTANKSWDINLGETDQPTASFPVLGTASLDEGNTTENIQAYIPSPGTYRFTLNKKTYSYSLDSLNTM